MLPEYFSNSKFLIFLILLSSPFYSYAQCTVNPIIGNAGYEARHQVSVSDTSSEFELIQAHLDYVEKLLREKKVEHLSGIQKQNRTKALDLLNTYWKNGQFPINTGYPNERKPCFVDENKTVCAVAFLVKQTVGGELVEQINKQYQYTYIHDMDCAELDKWVIDYGFTKNEIATIQPTYYTSRQSKKIKRVKVIRAKKAKKHEKKIHEIISYKEERAGKVIEINYKIVSFFGYVKDVRITKGEEYLTEKERKKLLRCVKRWRINNSSYSRLDAFVYIYFEDPGFYQEWIPYPFETMDTTLQEIIIKGKILDSKSNNPLVNAKIEVRGSNPTVGTLTDTEGNFKLSSQKDQLIQDELELEVISPLSIRLVKYIKKIPYNHQKINIKMHDLDDLYKDSRFVYFKNGIGKLPIDETVYIYAKE